MKNKKIIPTILAVVVLILSAGDANADQVVATLAATSPATDTVLPFGPNRLVMAVDLFSLWGENDVRFLKFQWDTGGDPILMPVSLYSGTTQLGEGHYWFGYSGGLYFELPPNTLLIPEGQHKVLEVRSGVWDIPWAYYPNRTIPRLSEARAVDLATGWEFDFVQPYPLSGNRIILGGPAVPEPRAFLLVGIGLLLAVLLRRYRR